MNCLTKCLMAVSMCFFIAGCSGDEEKTPPPPPPAKERVATPFDAQIGALNQSKDLAQRMDAQQKANQDQMDKMLKE